MMRYVAMGVLALFAACGQQSTVPSADELIDFPGDNMAMYITHQMTNAGVRTATLEADTAYTFESSRRWDLINVKVVFYNEQGGEAGTLTSRTADLNTEDNLFIARDDVVLITPGSNGERRLETEELHYDIAGETIWTDSPFVLLEDGRVTRGTRFRTDETLETWEVTGLYTEGSPGEEGIAF